MNARKQAVLVTGGSTGIGRESAQALLGAGYRVFGTVRTSADAERVKSELGPDFTPLLMDVTDAAAVEAGVRAMAEALPDGCLDGLVNNAGIATPGPLSAQSFDEIERMFAVNLFGALRVTRACLPLLGMRPNHAAPPGKIINISSGAGKISIPFLGAYVASKHALEGLSSSLRRELMPWNIAVVIIGPGNVRTPIWSKAPKESAYDHTPYASVFKNFLRFMFEGEKKGMLASEIASVIVEVMASREPRTRYAPVAQKFANWTLPRLLSDRQLDRMMYKTLGMQPLGTPAK